MYEGSGEEIYGKSTQLKSTFSSLQRCRCQYGFIFIDLADIVVSQICEILQKFELIAVQVHLTLSIKVPIFLSVKSTFATSYYSYYSYWSH